MPVIIGGIIAAGGALGGAAISAGSAKKASEGRDAAYKNALDYVTGLRNKSPGFLEAAFGSPLDPEAFLYEPVDISQSQLDTIQGNMNALPGAIQLMDRVNPEIWRNDLSRIRQFMPGFDEARNTYIGNTQALLRGQLPFQDVEDIVSNRSSLSASLGTPGGSRNATLRDLGLSRLDAMNQGGSMFQNFIQMAEAISPNAKQMRPQDSFFTPNERLQADILQRSLEQQGRASAAQAEAMPNPAQNALMNAEIGVRMAGLGAGYQPSQSGNILGAGIAQAASAFGAYYAQRQQQPQQYAQNPYMGSGGGIVPGAAQYEYNSATQQYQPMTSTAYNGNLYRTMGANTFSTFVV